MEDGEDNIPIGCFGATQSISGTTIGDVSGGDAYLYEYQFTWGPTADRCSQISTIVGVANAGSQLVISDIIDLVPGFPDGDDKRCDPGTRCTVMGVEGFNRPCGDINSFGTVQREVLLQL
jgi:hypothetical protein